MSDPLAGRQGLETEDPSNPLSRALNKLVREQGLSGAVLITFTEDRVGVCSTGKPDLFGRALEQLGNRILAAIDDGKFDPTVHLQ